MSKLALLMGAGDLAHHLAPELKEQGFAVIGARRSPSKAKGTFDVVAANAARVEDWRALLKQQPALIVLTLTPTEFSDAGYEAGYVKPVESFVTALNEQPADYQPLTLFVSSTSVYGERDGAWVDETTTTVPDTFSGERLLQAEELIKAQGRHSVCVRFSGIYGPGREGMIARLLNGDTRITPAWTNRIHVEDCAGVLAHLVKMYEADKPLQRVYLASDNEPVLQKEFVDWLAKRLHIDTATLPTSEFVGMRGSKRCNNKRLRDSGYKFKYPTYREGYAHL
ncbi:sugar nucleotide-binding protein [Aliidiomarina sp. Khilg15.8]